MKPWSQVALLAKREFLERARSKPFIITMALLAAAILAIGPVVNLLSGGEDEATKIGLVGDEPPGDRTRDPNTGNSVRHGYRSPTLRQPGSG